MNQTLVSAVFSLCLITLVASNQPRDDPPMIELKPDMSGTGNFNGNMGSGLTIDDNGGFMQGFDKRMEQMMNMMRERMAKMGSTMPDGFPGMPDGFPDLPKFPDDFGDSWKRFSKEIDQLKTVKGAKVAETRIEKSIKCVNNNCTICNNGKCISGNYTNIMQMGNCKDAVCTEGCDGFVVGEDPDGNECPICKCNDIGLIEPCAKDSDCRDTECHPKFKACQYPLPDGASRLERCMFRSDCDRGEYCSFVTQTCVKRKDDRK